MRKRGPRRCSIRWFGPHGVLVAALAGAGQGVLPATVPEDRQEDETHGRCAGDLGA
jgi:hypothetical protein